jgi:hypothetical protein
MHIARLLSEGVGSWLHFEYCCNRGSLFNERYLAAAVGQILYGRFGKKVLGDYTHPRLGAAASGAGRKPEIDYVVYEPISRKIQIAVETKWAGSSHCTVENIVWDLARLQMVADDTDAKAIFLLAGQKRKLDKLFGHKNFNLPPTKAPLLHSKSNAINRFELLPSIPERVGLFTKIFSPHQELLIPNRVSTQLHGPFPNGPKADHYQVLAWEVSVGHRGEKRSFQPGKIFRYANSSQKSTKGSI